MVAQAELAKGNIEEGAPLGIVGLCHVQGDWNMSPNVNQLNCRSRDGDRSCSIWLKKGICVDEGFRGRRWTGRHWERNWAAEV